jgi:hypothetical protein
VDRRYGSGLVDAAAAINPLIPTTSSDTHPAT